MRYADELVESRFASSPERDLDPKRFTSSSFNSGMASGRLSRTTSFSQLNIANKLENLDSALKEMAAQLTSVQAETLESQHYCESIKEQLNLKLDNKHISLKKKITDLAKFIEKTEAAELDRLTRVKGKFDQLFDSNLRIRTKFVQFRTRIECVEHAMGYYGGQEKYKS